MFYATTTTFAMFCANETLVCVNVVEKEIVLVAVISSFVLYSALNLHRLVVCNGGTPCGKRGRPLVVKVGVVLDAPRILLGVGASCTHGNELFKHDVPYLPVSCVGHAAQDDATRATRSADVIRGIH